MANPSTRPAVVNWAAGLLLLSALVWLWALTWPDGSLSPLLLAGLLYLGLILLSWAGRDTRVWIIPVVVILYCFVPLFAVIVEPVGVAERGRLVLLAFLAAAVGAFAGTCLLFRRDATAFFAR